MRKIFRVMLIVQALLLTACADVAAPTSAPLPTDIPAAVATATSVPLPTDTPQPQFGAISGRLSYPSEMVPALRVVAFGVEDGSSFFVDTEAGQSTFMLANLPPGVYHVIAYAIATPNIAGGYTQAVLCGLKIGCTDQSLIDVIVVANQETTQVNPDDWYVPEDTFPPMPVP